MNSRTDQSLVENRNTLDILMQEIRAELINQPVVSRNFSDFAKHIPRYDGGLELTREDLEYLSESLNRYGLESQPRVKKGFINRGLEAPIYLYMDEGGFDHDAESYRYGLSLMTVGVIMARIDGVVTSGEVDKVISHINNMNFLSPREKTALLARGHFFLQTSVGVGGGEQTRSYLKYAISKKAILQKLEAMSSGAQKAFVEVAKEMAIADGYLDKSEISFLQDIYRLLGMSARSVRGDLERFARDQYIEIEYIKEKPKELLLESLNEVDDILGDLLADFDDI